MRRLLPVLAIVVTLGSCSRPLTSFPLPPSTVNAKSFVVIGDWGTGLASSERVAERLCKWRKHHPFNLVVTTGDNIYPEGSPSDFESNFFEPFSCLLNNGVRWRSALGNHDVITDGGNPELNEPAFGMKSRNYVVRLSGVRFVVLDSNFIRRPWLRHHLKPQEGDEWTVVAFHHPVFSPGEHGSTPGLAEWMPRLFARKGVDLVLNGHDHLYSVTRPVKGIRYVVTGGGGASLYDCNDEPHVVLCKERHHFLYVRIAGGQMTVRAVPAKGKVIDRFRIR